MQNVRYSMYVMRDTHSHRYTYGVETRYVAQRDGNLRVWPQRTLQQLRSIVVEATCVVIAGHALLELRPVVEGEAAVRTNKHRCARVCV